MTWITTLLLFVLPPAGAPSADTSGGLATAPLLEFHRTTTSRLVTLDVEVEGVLRPIGSSESPIKHVRWWRNGIRERFAECDYVTGDAHGLGKTQLQGFERFREFAYSADEISVLSGWDPTHAYSLPLRPGGKHAEEYARAKCFVSPRDPAANYHAPLFWLLLVPSPSHSLEELVLDCKQVSATQADDELACISGVSAVLGKVRCFLDPRVGHLLRRVEYLSADGADSLITRVEVIEFSEPKPGIYFPKTAQISGPGRPLFEVRVKSARINEPIPERDLQITLPAGIRVYEPAKGLIHIWGANGRPEQTFSNEEQLGSWEKEMARKLTGAPEVAAASGAAAIVLFANLGLVLLIGVLIYIRRRLSTSSTRLE